MMALKVLGWILLGAIGLLAAAIAAADVYGMALGRLRITPELACTVMWDAWAASWVAVMVWSRPAASRPLARQELVYLALPAAGVCLLAFGSIATDFRPLWTVPGAFGWAVAALCGVGLLFTWWARVALGSLWSGSVSRKDAHTIVSTGAYGLVRHPIYTGLIVAAASHAVLVGQVANLAGAGLMAFGLWLKARFEERFLAAELGDAAYAEYSRRTPMLVPFWPIAR